MVEPKSTADDAEEYEQRWNEHIKQLYKLGHSLPDDEVEDFLDAVEDVKEFVPLAAEHTFSADDE